MPPRARLAAAPSNSGYRRAEGADVFSRRTFIPAAVVATTIVCFYGDTALLLGAKLP